jgi:hypothetical protein
MNSKVKITRAGVFEKSRTRHLILIARIIARIVLIDRVYKY